VNQDVSGVLLPWTSSIDTTAAQGWTITPLLVSSRGSGVSTGEIPLTPAADYPRTDLAPRVLAVQVAPAKSGSTRGRIILVGDATFASDDFTSHAPENLAFALNAVDWLAQDQALISIRSKDRQPPPLAFASSASRETVKYLNVIGIPVLIALLGLVHLARRRARTRMRFQPLSRIARSAA
jgi:hypothetical protein